MKTYSSAQRGVYLRKPDDVRKMLSRIANEVLKDQLAESKARTVSYVCTVLLKSMEAGDLEQRLSELEAQFTRKE